MNVNLFLRWHTEQLQDCLNLGHFQIVLNENKKLDCTMENHTDYEYLTSEITWGKGIRDVYNQGKKAEVIRCLCHETAHILTGEETEPMLDRKLTRQATFFDERVTETVGRICYRLYWRWLRETKPKGWRTYAFKP